MKIFHNVQNWTIETLLKKILDYLPTIALALIVLCIGFWLSNQISKWIIKAMRKRNVDSSVHSFVGALIRVILKIGVILSSISILGVNINSFIAAFGAAGITASLGFKDSISQFASGLQILITKPFKKGDYIEIESVAGTVDEIALMNTSLVTFDNKHVIIPNSHVTSTSITNYTAEDKRRMDLNFVIGYNADIFLAKSILRGLCEENKLVIMDPVPLIAVKEHTENGLKLVVQLWCKSDDYWTLYYEMQEKVKLAFDKAGITTPTEKIDVHVIER